MGLLAGAMGSFAVGAIGLLVGADFLAEVADAPPERRPELRQVLRTLPDQDDHENDHDDDENV